MQNSNFDHASNVRTMVQSAPYLLIVAVVCAVASVAPAADFVLTENGQSAYQIVLADNASPSTRHGAEELQMFLEQISGAKLPIVSDQQPQGPKEIVLGANAHLRKLGVAIDFAALGQEGYVIRTVGENLVIAGGQLRGNMYGVYGFLEDHLGCRWFAPDVSHIPKSTRLAIGPIDDRQVPALEFREPAVFECRDGDWCARNRMNSSSGRLEEKHGGTMNVSSLGHTFGYLVPPEKYFAEHPEYFALVKGERQQETSFHQPAQLCCTNPDVVRICTEGIRQAMRDQPQATVFSVSQNDSDKDDYCECPTCQALARQEDSQMAPVLQLVNRVAEAVEKEFPDKIVQTLAYQWSRRPPKQMRPRPNVAIMLCSIECCFSHPLATCDCAPNRAFRADLEGWAKAAERLWVWNYNTNFRQYLLPFPNQRVRGPNIRFFVAHNVKGIYEQDAYETSDSELWALGGYMTAKLLWNPNHDANKLMSEFLEGYYGKAAGPIRAYLDLLHDRVERANIHMGIFMEADGSYAAFAPSASGSPYLTDELLTKANALWQEAESCVAGEPEVLQRVKLSRMSVDYAILERARLQAQQKLPASASFLRLAAMRFEPFFEVTEEHSNLIRLAEGEALDIKTYRRDLANDLRLDVEMKP